MTSRRIPQMLAGLLLLSSLPLSPESCAFGPRKSAAPEAAAEELEIRNKWAISVGVNRFADANIPVQKFAQKSSADLSRALKDPDSGHFALDHVLVVNGPEASKAGIEQAFNEWLYKKALPDDLVVIYLNSRLLKNSAGETLICANDSKVADADKTAINLLELLKTAKQRIGSKYIICMLDCSPVPGCPEKSADDARSLAVKSGVTVFSAADLFKPSAEDAADMQTYFVHFFSEALKTGGANFPLAMLGEYVWQKVQEATKADNPANSQIPVMSLPSEQSQALAIPLGIIVKSSLPPKTVSIGHPIDRLGFDHPNIVPPSSAPGKPSIKIQPRARAAAPNAISAKTVAAAAQLAPLKEQNKQVLATCEDSGDDDFDPKLDLRPYVSKIKQDIQKKWQIPGGYENRKVTTTFSIMRDGSIGNAAIVEGSGEEAVDRSALEALHSASPLAPLPKGAPQSIDIRYVFDWKTKLGNQ